MSPRFAAQAPAVAPPRATLEVAPASVTVGDPVELVVHLQHAPGARYELSTESFDYAWVVLDHGGRATAAQDGVETTTYRLSIAALEAGEHELPAPVFRDANATAVQVEVVPGAPLEVAGVLASTEDAPRPIVGFPEPPASASSFAWWWLAVPLAAALAIGWWLRRRRRRAVPAPAAGPSPRERLQALEARDLEVDDEPGLAAEVHFELTHLLREHFDARAGKSRASATDEEWLAAAAPELGEAERTALRDLFAASREFKYGGAAATHWALRESLAAARAILDGASELQEAAS